MQTRKRASRSNPGGDDVLKQSLRATHTELLDDFQLLLNRKLRNLGELQSLPSAETRQRKQRVIETEAKPSEDTSDENIDVILGLASLMSHAAHYKTKKRAMKPKEETPAPISTPISTPVKPPINSPVSAPPKAPLSVAPKGPFSGAPKVQQELAPQRQSMPVMMNHCNYLQQMMYSRMIPPFIYYAGYPQVMQPPAKIEPARPPPQRTPFQLSDVARRGNSKRAATHIAIAYFIANCLAKPFPPEVSEAMKRVKTEQPLLS